MEFFSDYLLSTLLFLLKQLVLSIGLVAILSLRV